MMKIRRISSDYIPVEIQEEILKRLPAVKALLRFRSVSKAWNRLIDSRDFIVSYGVRHPQPDRFILRSHKYTTLVDNEDDGFVQQEFVPTDPELLTLTRVCSSHGLLCFQGCNGIILWNPSIRKFIRIQVPRIRSNKLPIQNNVGSEIFSLGVCPVTFDPTILHILCTHIPGVSIPWEVQVFTLSTGTWSIVSTPQFRKSIRLSWSQVDIDRFIYWLAWPFIIHSRHPYFLIISFDMIAKEFKEINLPRDLLFQFCITPSISKLRESLVVLGGEESVCSLWMMKKDQGVDRLFTKLYTISLPHASVKTLLGFRKTGELILATGFIENAKLEIYDPNSKAIDNLGIDGVDYTFFMCSYMETLLLLDHLDGFIYSFRK